MNPRGNDIVAAIVAASGSAFTAFANDIISLATGVCALILVLPRVKDAVKRLFNKHAPKKR